MLRSGTGDAGPSHLRESAMNFSMRRFAVLAAWTLFTCPSAHALIIVLDGNLDAAQVVDGGGSVSTATGFATVTIDTSAYTITTDLSWSGLSGPADRSHMHDAPAGQSRLDPPNDIFFHEVLSDSARTLICPWAGAVFVNCGPAAGSSHDVLQLSLADGYGFPDFNALVAAFVRNGVYLDMHTERYEGGEIRGQLIAAVPEPATWALACLGLAALAVVRRTGSGVRPSRQALRD
jgi:CHRD domain/PEP-CTERM motif